MSNALTMDDAFKKRAAMRRGSMVVGLARSPEERRMLEFEREQAVEPFRRAELIWPLVCDLSALRGEDGTELRLDRSFARVERRGR